MGEHLRRIPLQRPDHPRSRELHALLAPTIDHTYPHPRMVLTRRIAAVC